MLIKRGFLILLVFVATWLTLGACGTDAPPSGNPQPAVFLPRRLPPEPGGVHEELLAQFRGELVLEGGCLRVYEGDPEDSVLPVWPHDYTLSIKDEAVEVLDGTGHVVARVGEPVDLVGGFASWGVNMAEPVPEKMFNNCRAPFWIVSNARLLNKKE